MKIMYMVLGPFMTNTYIVYNEQTLEGLVVDPSFSPEQYIHAIQEKKIHLKSILLTHGHVDHMAGMNELRKAFPEAEMYMDRRDREFLRDPEKNLSYMFPTPVLVDDIASSGRTLAVAARKLVEQGLRQPECVVVHALLDEAAYAELSGVFSRFTSTDAVPHPSNRIALASLLADALRRNLHD